MAIAESILPEFEHEMATTRRLLERVPADRAAWKPHPKSMMLGDLAVHLANLPYWGIMTLKQDYFDTKSPEGEATLSGTFDSVEAMLKTFDENVSVARETLQGASDADMMEMWSLKSGDHTIFSMPRAAVFRSFVISHIIHHRGQLSVYLRLNDVPLPSIYGPTADEA